MGCGHSKDVVRPKEKFGETEKQTVLIFGMPDSGQSVFIKMIEKCFVNAGGFNQNPFVFTAVSTDREDRKNWINEYTTQPNVIASFFFVDISTPAAVLLSVKTLNWMCSQMAEGQDPPHVVGLVRNPKESNNFTQLKDYLAHGVEANTFNDNNQADIQKYVEYINACAAKHAPPTEEQPN
ncbi:hypothetical protein TRFO_02282 [Tritrichomonas foetus]|uniref:Ras family protein n=1 Tax=Tritrichomonas foetus TaxID=1144522 RepID=A0A1J4J7U0_9EUKA|nr:hypothetical protein TRFO_02282 [Tritrichomonas foetus]|eukprot:OHS95274.1 hypothetical protein TRFO_02282 [Tritrichomonas foetus]